jgi:hypothetical protein
MTFMIVDTDSYDILLGLDMLIKIGAIVDVEQGLIQVRRGLGTDVEVLPLTVVNLVQRSDSRADGRDGDDARKQILGNPEAGYGSTLSCKYGTNERGRVQETDSDSDSSESSDEGTKVVGLDGGAFEFGDTEFEDLVVKEGS